MRKMDLEKMMLVAEFVVGFDIVVDSVSLFVVDSVVDIDFDFVVASFGKLK